MDNSSDVNLTFEFCPTPFEDRTPTLRRRILDLRSTLFARAYVYCKYGPEFPSNAIDSLKSNAISDESATLRNEYFTAATAAFSAIVSASTDLLFSAACSTIS